MTPELITVLSLVVAALAVFVGPLVSWIITKRQLESAQRLAVTQLVAPLRQAWINDLRLVLTELLSAAHYYYVAGFEERTDAEYRRLTELEQRLELMLNPAEQQHKELLSLVRLFIEALEGGASQVNDDRFFRAHKMVRDAARAILKIEWDRVKAGESPTTKP